MKMTNHPCRFLVAAVAAIATIMAGAGLGLAAPAGAQPPAGKTYFTILMGLQGPYDVVAICLRFTASEMCLVEGVCGPWARTGPGGRETGFAFDIALENIGLMVSFNGQARVDKRGSRDSIAGVAAIGFDDVVQNVSFAGRTMGPERCRRLAGDFAVMTADWSHAFCMARASFGDPAESPYVLPYPVGRTFRVDQSYCSYGGSHHSKFSYDFNTPIGVPVVAARAGTVWIASDDYEDGDRTDDHINSLWIEHADGTVAQYSHLAHDSILFEPGEPVATGQRVATSGDTGSYPHLHFAVYRNRQLIDDNSLPVNFSNASGPLDERGGLMTGASYEALSY